MRDLATGCGCGKCIEREVVEKNSMNNTQEVVLHSKAHKV